MNSKENYLRTIYRLTEEGEERATTSEVSTSLEVSDASASEAIQKLEEENFVCRAAYKGFTLSPPGKEKGKRLQEKYDRLEKIFSETGVEDPGKEADRVEHAISLEAVEKIENRLEEK